MARGGIDLGGTKIEAVIVDDADTPLAQARRPTPTSGGPESVTAELAVALREAAKSAGVEVGALAGVGVGSPGEADGEAGTIANARNLPDWIEPFPLAATLGEALGVPVRVGNDVAVAVEAEAALGAGRSYRRFLGLWWGTGVGGTIVVDGQRWPGGEFGHMVVRLGGARCPCGRRGCVEAYAGRGAMEARARRAAKRGAKTELFRLMEKRGRTRLTSGVWEQALADGDKLADRLVERAIGALGAGAASARNLVEIDAVVLGGGLGTRLGAGAAERIRAAMLPHLFADDKPPAVVPAELGDLGGAIGAARLVSA
jgi:glucokinase